MSLAGWVIRFLCPVPVGVSDQVQKAFVSCLTLGMEHALHLRLYDCGSGPGPLTSGRYVFSGNGRCRALLGGDC